VRTIESWYIHISYNIFSQDTFVTVPDVDRLGVENSIA
jgi:hypothetical protein